MGMQTSLYGQQLPGTDVLLEGHVGVGEGIVDGQTEESSHLPHELQDEEVTEEIHPSTLVTRA